MTLPYPITDALEFDSNLPADQVSSVGIGPTLPRVPFIPRAPSVPRQQPYYTSRPYSLYSSYPPISSGKPLSLSQSVPPLQKQSLTIPYPPHPYDSVSSASYHFQPAIEPRIENPRPPTTYPSAPYYNPISQENPNPPTTYPADPYPNSHDNTNPQTTYPAAPYYNAVFQENENPNPPTAYATDPSPNPASHENAHPPTTYSTVPYQHVASQATPSSQPTSFEDKIARISVQDGNTPQSFASAKALANYLKIFPEADNDQGCRVFKYGPSCPTNLLMPLFEHFDFPRFSTFPYGFAGDFSVADHWGTGSCNCQKCTEGRPCGHYVLHKNFQFYVYEDVAASPTTSPKITSTTNGLIISAGGRSVCILPSIYNDFCLLTMG